MNLLLIIAVTHPTVTVVKLNLKNLKKIPEQDSNP